MGNALRLFNTLTRSKEEFKPIQPPQVGLYTCGPTVYGYQHLGNYRTYIFEDILKRTLILLGYRVRHVMNITDVGHLTSQADEGEDKIEKSARREGKSAWELSRFYTDAFLKDSRDLALSPPEVLCRATDHIPEQIDLVRRLEAKGCLYKTSDGLYFDSAKFAEYGRLAGGSLEGPARGRIAQNPEKRAAADFAVWKFSIPKGLRQMEWNSPWGVGFPGWHIECSAMSMKYLGESFDIHAGGVDHIPVHHTNEIAQSQAATGKPLARFWAHGEFLVLNDSKMAKSEGTGITVEGLKNRGFSPLDYRYHALTVHYRKQLDFTWDSLEASKKARARLREIAAELAKKEAHPRPIIPPREGGVGREAPSEGGAASTAAADLKSAFTERLSDDLDAPGALAFLWETLRKDIPAPAKLKILEASESVFNLGIFDKEVPLELPKEAAALIDRRARARAARDYALSDQIRESLGRLGIAVEDTPEGQKWRKA